MIQTNFDDKRNVLITEFEGKIDMRQAEEFYTNFQTFLPKLGKGFKLLTDLSRAQFVDPNIQELVKRTMDLLNDQGVREIIRVIPDPERDIGFNIMSLFHYSKDVKIHTVEFREEADALLSNE